MNRIRKGYVLAPLAVLVLAACGGSDGEDNNTVSYAPLPITESNAKSVTKDVLVSSQSLGGQSGINALSPTLPKAAPVKKALTEMVDGTYSSTKLSQTQECADGGSITITDVSGTGMAYTANDCRYSSGIDNQQMTIRIDGKLAMAIQEASGFPPRQGFPADASWNTVTVSFSDQAQWKWSYDDFVIQIEGNGSTSLTYDGDMLTKVGTNDMSGPSYVAIGSNSLRIKANSTVNNTNADFSVNGLSFESLTHTVNGPDFTEAVYNTTYGSGTLAGVGGQVTVTTLKNLIYDNGTVAPMESGTLKITGANNSSVTVIVPGRASDVQLDIDSDGDGVTDQVQDLSWAELDV